MGVLVGDGIEGIISLFFYVTANSLKHSSLMHFESSGCRVSCMPWADRLVYLLGGGVGSMLGRYSFIM